MNMEPILVIHDSTDSSVSAEVLLKKIGYNYSLVSIDNISAEFIVASAVEVVVFDLSMTSSACVKILEKLDKISEISGMKNCPVLIVAEESLHLEQAARGAYSNFFFIKPVSEDEFLLAIRQALAALK